MTWKWDIFRSGSHGGYLVATCSGCFAVKEVVCVSQCFSSPAAFVLLHDKSVEL